ncbi:MAG: ATP-dependent Clp protease proteolytic subunit, partial [Oscillospiraceae bacterium]|nr:ATP-dependent Clp protease proteolytic subunit [Oscillospiraceae bacterium]
GNVRQMLPHSRVMIHDPSYSRNDIGGRKPHEIQRELDSLNKTKQILAEIIAERTGKDIEEVCKITAEDSYFYAEEAIEFGLATNVLKGE